MSVSVCDVSVGVGVDVDVYVSLYTHTKQDAAPGLLSRCNCLFFCRLRLQIYRGYTGPIFEDVEGSLADEQTPYIHRPLLQKSPTQ